MKLLDLTSIETGSADLRRAALLLHSMPAGDRAWLLDQLATQDRTRLNPLLGELQDLGIPADPTLVSDALIASESTTSPAHHAIVQILLKEPDRLVVALLRCGPWEWQAELFASLPPSRRRSIEAALRTTDTEAPPAPALRDALVQGMHLRAAQAPASASGSPAPWQRVWQLVTARFGNLRT